MTIDRRKIFTVGMVWTDFVKRLPRDYPRYRRDYPNILLTDLQAAAMKAQQQPHVAFLYQPTPQYLPHAANWFSILGL